MAQQSVLVASEAQKISVPLVRWHRCVKPAPGAGNSEKGDRDEYILPDIHSQRKTHRPGRKSKNHDGRKEFDSHPIRGLQY